ncbi:aspartate aminotransferase family protein [Frankia sp. AgB1.9]|uniref:pyridoxal phosphate-dependent decarboxylase family protein n=1 Tax=unclassified Frankia TaxID=2632575 RepID=UPI00193490F6|nr:MULTISPECIES: aminotransferase class V-fold PLP-dependent enzyme [unclassified Frankia]MBL7489362.1 aspartate aminotransferase family protein [Frankia sp. AgW1.1]MBL7548701.1 aspartate aminotransferase family protein [Frankia sp. AgB1.9]MBL7619299.1 aspartate aminotransferase family protein [Frankia sp. AgB1.8]
MTSSESLPTQGTPAADVLASVRANRHDDAPWREGRIFSLIYHPDDPELEELLAAVSREYLAENALNPFRFPSLARLEQEAADMVSGLLHGPPGAGGLTSGGTESIFVAVSVARAVAQERGVETPEIITARTAHPAFAKACHLLGVRQTRVDVGPDFRADAAAIRAAIGPDTAMVVASAPCYPYGVIDPVPEIAAAAAAAGVLCHVDACLGGLLLPFWERLGEPVPPWDFRVPGVTSISADIHKYGYSFKGASTILWRDPDLAFKRVWFDDGVWGGGLYATATPAGTRPAPPIAGAWAALKYHGVEGYLAKARAVRDATRRLVAGIESIDGLRLTIRPDAAVFQFASEDVDLAAVADVLEERRWWLNRQPGGLHLMVSPYHVHIVDELLAELRAAVDQVRAGRRSQGAAASYTGLRTPPTG